MIVVSDTSPFNYLVQIGHIEVLPRLFGAILTPPAVIAELAHPRSPDMVRAWAGKVPSWLTVRRATVLTPIADVDQGEAEALALALEVRADAILMDDAKGRAVARRLNLRPKGTLGVLAIAGETGLLDLVVALDRLEATSFRAPKPELDAMRRRWRDRG